MARLIISILFLASLSLNAQQYIAKDGEITFFSEAPLENISAINKQVSAVYDNDSKEIVFQLYIKDFIFPKALMQEHFNENYLESDVYPKSIFSGKVISQEIKSCTVEGELTIHGKKNIITVSGILEKENNTVNISARFMIKLQDYDIKIPKIVMYKLAEEIEVTVNIKLKEL
tara:strand:- start:15173 stop:15691 length:519 start_codon:yes stop_codon:yes gene_type:complete